MRNIILLIGCLIAFSCSDMNDNIKEYLDRGEVNYLAKLDSVTIRGGHNRIRVDWLMSYDPRVEYCNLYWDGGPDTLTLRINRDEIDEDGYLSAIFDGLEEGSYIFYLYHTGEKGYNSIQEEVTGYVYGDIYQSNLTHRRVKNIAIDDEVATLYWGPVADDAVSCTVIYDNVSGERKEVVVYPEETQTEIDDFVPGEEFIVRTDYKPDPDALDIFSITSDPIIFRVTGPIDYDRSEWSISVSHPLPPESGNNRGECILDGISNTFLSMIKPGHSMDGITVGESEDVYFIIDMKQAQEVDYFRYVHRNTNTALRFFALSVYGSMDGENFAVIQESVDIPGADVSAVVDGGDVQIPKTNYRYYKFSFTKWLNGTAPGQINEFYLGYIIK